MQPTGVDDCPELPNTVGGIVIDIYLMALTLHRDDESAYLSYDRNGDGVIDEEEALLRHLANGIYSLIND